MDEAIDKFFQASKQRWRASATVHRCPLIRNMTVNAAAASQTGCDSQETPRYPILTATDITVPILAPAFDMTMYKTMYRDLFLMAGIQQRAKNNVTHASNDANDVNSPKPRYSLSTGSIAMMAVRFI